MTRTIAIVIALGLSACAPSTHATAFRQATSKASAQEVQVFTETRPDRPFEEIGTIEIAASELANSKYGDLIERARVRAAEMGADAIIVTRDPKSHSNTFAYVPPERKKHGQLVSASTHTTETPRIQVAAIVWKASSSN
jgi:hypothetical protein